VTSRHSESGFSLVELLVATALLLVVSSIVTGALMQMTQAQATIWNRTEMHSGIRGATELLQQEVGQAGRAALSATVSLLAPVGPTAGTCDPSAPTAPADTVAVVSKDAAGNVVVSVNGVNPLSGIFAQGGANPAYMLMATLDGDNQEVVKIGAVDKVGSTITACFTKPHLAGAVITPLGAFATGIVPNVGIANGSTPTVLKLYGDIIGDGNMVYVEYTCDAVNHNLYRNVMPYDAVGKPAVTNAQILLSNIIPNPGGTDCFTYQTTKLNVQGIDVYFVLDVAVTLTVQTQQLDPITKQFQTETKALLNVSPRNVFTAWEMASLDFTDHVQSTPVSVTALVQ
jgi:prepilin-type N-terminal cleavage/methylation domain-containing protein